MGGTLRINDPTTTGTLLKTLWYIPIYLEQPHLFYLKGYKDCYSITSAERVHFYINL